MGLMAQSKGIRNMNLKSSKDAADLMASSKSEAEWNANCDQIKAANNGYPDWWFTTIVVSGLSARTAAKFGRDDKIHVRAL